MTTERRQQVERVFRAALERPALEREGLVAELCAGDDALKREVESLLARAGVTGPLDAPELEAAASVIGTAGTSLLGRRVGPYVIDSLLGAGGMGEVYRAKDSRLGREVALKILPEAWAVDSERRSRFEREARMLAALNHPHIGAIYGLEESSGICALVLELVEGATLAERIGRGEGGRGGMPADEALQIARQIAEALEAAHEKGIVHRDLKPANVKLTPDGRVKVLDFGLAKVPAAETPDASQSPTMSTGGTREGTILGTAKYMSPEQARGKPVDKRTDIWAFGCVLYEMLTGRPAFPGDTISDTIAAILQREPDWRALPDGTPRHVRRLLQRCLRKDARERLRDVGDARLEMENAEVGEDVPATTNGAPGRRPFATVAWGVAFASLLLAAYVLVRPRPAPTGGGAAAMRFSAVTNVSGVEAQPSFSPDGRSVAYISNRGGQWDVYVGLVTGGSPIRITNDPSLETRPRWSPDGSRLLFSRLNDAGLFDVWEVPALGGTARRLVLNGIHATWSPDGRSMAYGSGGVLWICDAKGANPRAVTKTEEQVAHIQPAFSRDGRSLAFIRRREGPYGELAVLDLATGAVRNVTRDGALALSPVWSPDGRFLYFASSRGGALNIWKIPSASGEARQVTAGQGEDTDIDLSADGKRMVFSSFRVNVNLAEVSLEGPSSGQLRWLTTDSARGELAPRYSPDGSHIAYFSNRSGAERESIWVMDSDGGNPSALAEDDRININPRWASDSQQVLYLSRTADRVEREIRRISLAGGPPRALPIRTWDNIWGDVAPDGRVLYRVSADEGELYDPRTNRREKVVDLHGTPLWARDGRSFAYATHPESRDAGGAGLWTDTVDGPRRQVFQGWVMSFAWTRTGELLVVEGKASLKGFLWRVDGEGRRTLVLSDLPLLFTSHANTISRYRFDVHPDGRRIVAEALDSFEADIGLIDNVL